MKVKRTVAHKPKETLAAEMNSMLKSPAAKRAKIYTLNAYNFSVELRDMYIASVKGAGIQEVGYEQFHLTEEHTLEKMVDASRTTINLSPESHDVEISRLAGRGNYTVDEMEAWIERAFEIGVYSVNVWFFIGMPKQTESSVFDTVEYSKGLLARFKGKRVYPLLTPMVPFLDPGCNYFEEPDKWGYRVFPQLGGADQLRDPVVISRSDRLNLLRRPRCNDYRQTRSRCSPPWNRARSARAASRREGARLHRLGDLSGRGAREGG